MTYLVLALSAFAAQALMFVPIVPLLIGAGALAAHGETRLPLVLVALTTGIAAGDFLWYRIGRQRGRSVLGRLCRMALEPSTCLRRTENLFLRYGAAALIFAKFVPGLSTVALPLAGVFGMRPRRFVAHDIPGVLLWVGAYLAVGYLSSGPLVAIGSRAPWSGRSWVLVAAGSLAAYVAWKQVRRRIVLRQLRMARISVHELKRRLDTDAAPVVLDLRHPLDFGSDPCVIPGALYIPAEDLPERHAEIPRDREVVLYCTCPDEITSAKQALRLRRRGVRHVRPLQGGLSAWRDADLPTERREPVIPEAGAFRA